MSDETKTTGENDKVKLIFSSAPREAVIAWSDAKTDAERKAVLEKHPKIKEILSPGHWSHIV